MTELQEGQPAPNFSAPDQTGAIIQLHQFRGQTVVLYFYPRDMTPGCTVEACGFRDEFAAFKKKNTVILGVSPDPIERHQKFIRKFKLPFSLIADPDHKIAELYGVWVKKSFLGKKYMGIERATFVISPDGTLQKIFRKVKVLGHVKNVFNSL